MSAKNSRRFSTLRYLHKREYSDRNVSGISLMRNRLNEARNLFRKNLFSHYGCVNAIEFSSDGEWLVSGGDDRRILVWNIEKAIHEAGLPICMKGEHGSNIFCLGFDNSRQKIFSAGNDEQVIVHDFNTGATVDVFLHEEAVYGLSVDPLNDNVFASACEDGRILIWDIREPSSTEPFCLANYKSVFHAVMYNPMEPRLLTTANSKEGIALWDIRAPRSCLLRYGNGLASESCMSARFNSSGTKILALRRRLPPVLYDVHSSSAICQFDHPEYYNSCTMKSCCFAGDNDQFVLSGSDDFNLYMWKIPSEGSNVNWVDEAHMILKGHRSIVNQVRFNPCNFLLVSSGVEKIIKLWSPFNVPKSTGGLDRDSSTVDKLRKVYSHEEYINLILQSGQVMTHDYSHKSTLEDPRMMAFFDSLIQREIEGWNSDTSKSSVNTETWPTAVAEDNPSGSESSSSTSSEGEAGVGARGVSPLTVAYANAIANRVDANGESNISTELNIWSDQPLVVDHHHTNRISQLIVQRRQQLKRAATLKIAARSKLHSRARRNAKSSELPQKNKVKLAAQESSSEEDSDLSVGDSASASFTKSSTIKERRKSMNSVRTKILLDLSDSESDKTESPTSEKDSRTSNCNDRNSSYSAPSSLNLTSETNSHVDDDLQNGHDSGTSDIENNISTTSSELHNASETSNGEAGTPDSGIASNSCDLNENTSVTSSTPDAAWTQFKRFRTRLERACRNYRGRKGDDLEQSD